VANLVKKSLLQNKMTCLLQINAFCCSMSMKNKCGLTPGSYTFPLQKNVSNEQNNPSYPVVM
jgi:hypothetical protein